MLACVHSTHTAGFFNQRAYSRPFQARRVAAIPLSRQPLVCSAQMLKVVGISGSLRKASSNTGLLRAAAAYFPKDAQFEIVSIKDLPLFDGDVEAAGVPPAVKAFVDKLSAADAVLFACPEYNYSIAAPLKNAIDWASRTPGALNGKPAAVMSAAGGMGGSRAQYHLRQVGVFLDLKMVAKPEVTLNAFAGEFDSATGDVKGDDAKDKIKQLVEALVQWTKIVKAGTAAAAAN